jgi:hypothetical protein
VWSSPEAAAQRWLHDAAERQRLHDWERTAASRAWQGQKPSVVVTEPHNYDDPHVPVIVIMTSDSHTYVPHNLKGLLSSEQDPITGVLQYYNSLFKIPSE